LDTGREDRKGKAVRGHERTSQDHAFTVVWNPEGRVGFPISSLPIGSSNNAARDRAGLDKKLVPYSARHTYGTYTMEKSRNVFAVAKSMVHVDLKSMEPYQHQELEPLRQIINQRNQQKKVGQVLENEDSGAYDSSSASA
jgi:site-specific recombinase XerC